MDSPKPIVALAMASEPGEPTASRAAASAGHFARPPPPPPPPPPQQPLLAPLPPGCRRGTLRLLQPDSSACCSDDDDDDDDAAGEMLPMAPSRCCNGHGNGRALTKADLASQQHQQQQQQHSFPEQQAQAQAQLQSQSTMVSSPTASVLSTSTTPLRKDESPMTSLSQVNISGLRAATDTSRQMSRRLLWVFLLTICFAVMVAQITDRVRHFLSEPISVQISVSRNRSLTYPAISICNKNKFNMSAVHRLRQLHRLPESNGSSQDIADLLNIPGMDAMRLWRETKHERRQIVKECWFGRNVTCDQRGTWSISLTTMGVCHTYRLNDSLVHLAGIFHNLYLKIQEKEPELYKGDAGWKFYIHNPAELPTLGVQIWALHHSRNPCEKDLNYLQNNCFFDCFMTRLHLENISCSLPYMMGSPLPPCSTPASYRHTETKTNDLFFYGQWNPNDCQCKSQCLKTLFTSSLESTTDKYNVHRGGQRARVRIYYQNLQFEFIKEEVGYGTIDLLCDIGGTLSLLMGASVLTCCELFEVAWVSLVYNTCKKAHKRRTSKRRKSRRESMTLIGSKKQGQDAPATILEDDALKEQV